MPVAVAVNLHLGTTDTPELNPIEMQWRVIKRVLSAKVFGTLDEMEQSVCTLFARKKILPVKMFNYLMC